MALVTFLMTTYNGGEFLRPAIASALAQTERNFRMLVIDDASSDGSADVARAFRDPRIEVVALERNVGQTAALNMGLERIQTPWVARLDQDDLAAATRLERQLSHVADRPETVLVGSLIDFVDSSGRVIGSFRPATEPADVLREIYARGCPIIHSAVLYRAAAARAVGGYPTEYSYAQDLAMWILLSAHGEIANVPEALTSVRIHPDQTSRAPAVSAIQLGEMLEITERLPGHVMLEGKWERLWQARRTRLMLERAYVAARARDGRLALTSATAGLGRLIRDPLAVASIAKLVLGAVAKRARPRHRGVGHATRPRAITKVKP